MGRQAPSFANSTLPYRLVQEGSADASVDLGACWLVDWFQINNVTAVDVVADRLEFCRVNLKQPPVPRFWMSLRGDGLATRGVSILRQRPHRSFHRGAVLQGYHAPHHLPRLSRFEVPA